MLKVLTEEERFNIIRPIVGGCNYDKFNIPMMKGVSINDVDWDHLNIQGFQSASIKNDNSHTLLTMFSYDKCLARLWNNPLKRIGLFQTFAALGTPDFSLYPAMNRNDIQYNIYKARWLGRTWQNYGCKVIPTIGWAAPNTYEICFSGLPSESVVLISTLGCLKRQNDFLEGFNEMKRRIHPTLIIVYGSMIEGMSGTFLVYPYHDSFSKKTDQISLDISPRIFTIKEAL